MVHGVGVVEGSRLSYRSNGCSCWASSLSFITFIHSSSINTGISNITPSFQRRITRPRIRNNPTHHSKNVKTTSNPSNSFFPCFDTFLRHSISPSVQELKNRTTPEKQQQRAISHHHPSHGLILFHHHLLFSKFTNRLCCVVFTVKRHALQTENQAQESPRFLPIQE